jgi:hypothetical protein
VKGQAVSRAQGWTQRAAAACHAMAHGPRRGWLKRAGRLVRRFAQFEHFAVLDDPLLEAEEIRAAGVRLGRR